MRNDQLSDSSSLMITCVKNNPLICPLMFADPSKQVLTYAQIVCIK